MRCAGWAEVAPVVVVGGHDNNVMLDRAWSMLAGLSGPGRLTFPGAFAPSRSRRDRADPCRRRRPTAPRLHRALRHAAQLRRFDRPGETTGGFTAGIKRVHDAYGEWLEQNADAATDKVIWAAHLLVISARRPEVNARSTSEMTTPPRRPRFLRSRTQPSGTSTVLKNYPARSPVATPVGCCRSGSTSPGRTRRRRR